MRIYKCLLPLPQEILSEIFIWVVIELDTWRVVGEGGDPFVEFLSIEIDTILGQIHNIWRWSLLVTSVLKFPISELLVLVHQQIRNKL